MSEIFVFLHGGLVQDVYVDGISAGPENITSYDTHGDDTYFESEAITIIQEILKLALNDEAKLRDIQHLVDRVVFS